MHYQAAHTIALPAHLTLLPHPRGHPQTNQVDDMWPAKTKAGKDCTKCLDKGNFCHIHEKDSSAAEPSSPKHAGSAEVDKAETTQLPMCLWCLLCVCAWGWCVWGVWCGGGFGVAFSAESYPIAASEFGDQAGADVAVHISLQNAQRHSRLMRKCLCFYAIIMNINFFFIIFNPLLLVYPLSSTAALLCFFRSRYRLQQAMLLLRTVLGNFLNLTR